MTATYTEPVVNRAFMVCYLHQKTKVLQAASLKTTGTLCCTRVWPCETTLIVAFLQRLCNGIPCKPQKGNKSPWVNYKAAILCA